MQSECFPNTFSGKSDDAYKTLLVYSQESKELQWRKLYRHRHQQRLLKKDQAYFTPLYINSVWMYGGKATCFT